MCSSISFAYAPTGTPCVSPIAMRENALSISADQSTGFFAPLGTMRTSSFCRRSCLDATSPAVSRRSISRFPAEKNTSAVPPCSIACDSAPLAPKLKETFTPGCVASYRSPSSCKTSVRLAAAATRTSLSEFVSFAQPTLKRAPNTKTARKKNLGTRRICYPHFKK